MIPPLLTSWKLRSLNEVVLHRHKGNNIHQESGSSPACETAENGEYREKQHESAVVAALKVPWACLCAYKGEQKGKNEPCEPCFPAPRSEDPESSYRERGEAQGYAGHEERNCRAENKHCMSVERRTACRADC